MPSRESRSVRVDPDVWSDFVDWVVQTEGQKHGEIGRHVENALSEYIDQDRFARIEDRQETMQDTLETIAESVSETSTEHTHTGPTTVPDRVEKIGAELRGVDGIIFAEDDVEDAIRTHAGASDRTLRKYKQEIKAAGEAYEIPRPGSSVWTVDRGQWLSWADGYLDDVPDADLSEIIDPYPLTTDDYYRLAEARL